MSYSPPLRLNLHVIGTQEVTGRYIVLQRHSSRMVFDEKRNTKVIKASQLVLTQTQKAVLTESDYAGYLLVIIDERGEQLAVYSNLKAFEGRAEFLSTLRPNSTFSQSDLDAPPK